MKLFRRKKKKSAGDRWLPRRLKTTREGKLLIFFTLGVGFAAINTGNNLLYLVLGMLLSLIVVSGILSELTLRGVTVRRRYHDTIYAGRPTFLTLEVTNTKRRFASFSVEIEEIFNTDQPIKQRPGYALVVRAGQRHTVTTRLTFERRGVHQSQGLRIATRFPFAFFRKWRVVRDPLEMVAFPSVHEVSAPPQAANVQGEHASRRRIGPGDEYHGLHEFRQGDDPRSIHWKSTARQRRVIAREFEARKSRYIWLMVPNRISVPGSEMDVEGAISETASLAVDFLGKGWMVGLSTIDGAVRPDRGSGHLRRMMDHLARVEIHTAAPHGAEEGKGLDLVRSATGHRLLVRHPSQKVLGYDGRFDSVHEPKVGMADAAEAA